MTAPALSDAPIGNAEADALLSRPFAGYGTVLLAVSGGADSMALMHLAADWHARAAEPKPDLVVATVDHGLRHDSAAEAHWVAARATALGLKHRILSWDAPKPVTGIQAGAREARYRLLAGLAHAQPRQPVAIALAHHQDDQAETFLMRLARGSGVDGLAAMPERRALGGAHDVAIVRPLLRVPKRRLVATLQSKGLAWLDDPSNEQLRFERVRLRRAAPALAAAGLHNDKLALAATRLARARSALEQAADALEARAVDYHGGTYATVSRPWLAAAPAEIRLRTIGRAMLRLGGQEEGPRLGQLESLMDRLDVDQVVPGVTVAGCCIEATNDEIRIYREPGRQGLGSVTLAPGEARLWDRRFDVAAAAANPRPLTIRTLTANELAALRKSAEASGAVSPSVPRRAALTVPSVWDGDELLGAPHLLVPSAQLDQAISVRWVGNGLPPDTTTAGTTQS